MDFYPENILLEIISLLNASSPPGESLNAEEDAAVSLRDISLVWWLEYFLRTEPAAFAEKFDSLPRAEQSALVAQFWRCFLHRPLMRRLFPAQSRPEPPHPWKLIREGSLVQLIGEEDHKGLRGLYYLFPHNRLWPGLATALLGEGFLTPEDLSGVHSAMEFTRQSRLDVVRRRAEEPRFSRGASDSRPLVDKESPPIAGEPEIPAVKPKKDRKRKKPTGQLSLFD
jgi:hypothetical protein